MKKSIIIGNGINIGFSENDDYKNYKIIQRVLENLDTDKYNEVFMNSISKEELKGVIIGLNNFFRSKLIKGIEVLRWCENEEELRSLVEISKRYTDKSLEIVDIGMEDYFFAMKIFNNRFKEDNVSIDALDKGLRWLFLDSIYNNGDIELVYEKMECFRSTLNKYDMVFTLNYDTNLDKIYKEKVYHLHGSFNVLEDIYRRDTILGYIDSKEEKPLEIIENMKHIYCNGVMGYSGDCKERDMLMYTNEKEALNIVLARIMNKDDIEARAWINDAVRSNDSSKKPLLDAIKAKIERHDLDYSEYPLSEFKSIEGELHILGMSPNNDSHILNMINSNNKIERVVFYFVTSEDMEGARKNIKKPIQFINTIKFLDKIKKISKF